MKTLENNKLIAEFMGYDFTITDNKIQTTTINDLDFEKSWDWLIPVINKIYELDLYYTYKNENSGFLKYGGIEINIKFIETTYNSVIEFIKWYNNQNK